MDVTITAHLDTPIIGQVGILDGPLAWAAAQDAMSHGVTLDPISDEHCPDMDLPLETWSRGDHWGWCVSSPVGEPVHYSATEIRRKPAAQAMARYTAAREHHNGLGPTKARNVTLATAHYTRIQWHADVTDRDRLDMLLGHITHLGARHRNGFGHVTRWEITDGPHGGWEQRPLPHPDGTLMRVRAPYWHPTERTTCAHPQ